MAPNHTLLCLILASAALAQAPIDPQRLPLTRASGLLFDEPTPGQHWVRGETYKARIAADGVTFLPVFANAKAATPIRFRLAGGDAKPVRAGQSFCFQHGANLVETWEPRARGIEQYFVLASRPAAGDLVLGVEVTTDLEYRGYRDGLVFAAPGLGEITYGEGVVFDAAGQRAPIIPQFEATATGRGSITLRVDAAFLDHAAYPVTVDPFVSNFAVTTSTRSQFHPDVVREPMSGDFVVIYEEVFTSSDHDILAQRFRPDGTLVGQVIFDVTTDSCIDPKICAEDDGSEVLAIWDNDGNAKGIQSRSHSLSLGTSRPVAQVTSDGALEDSRTPDVGGGSRVVINNLGQMAVFVRRTGGVNYSLRGVRLQSNGIPTGGEFVIDSTPGCDPRPDIAPTGGVPLHWGVVWQAHTSLCANPDIWFAGLNFAGPIQPAFELEGDNDDETIPRVFTAGSDSLVGWVQPSGSFGLDTVAVLVRRTGSTFAQVGPKVSLPAAEPGAPRGANQASLALGFDGCRHSYAYMQDQRPYAACVSVADGSYLFSEGHVSLSPTTNDCGATAMAWVPDPATSQVRYAVVWQENMGSHFDVRGAFYDGRAATGGVTVVRTVCGRTQTTIQADGEPIIGHRFGVQLGGVLGAPVLMIGQPAVAPITLCTSLPTNCLLGVFPILVNVAAAGFQTTVPCDPFLVGGRLAFQGVDIGAGTGCPTSTFGVPLRTTNTLVVTFQ